MHNLVISRVDYKRANLSKEVINERHEGLDGFVYRDVFVA